jgi:hypothetical protein
MKTYTTQMLPGITLAAIAQNQADAQRFAGFLYESSKNGWSFEQATEVAGVGVLVILSHAPFMAPAAGT